MRYDRNERAVPLAEGHADHLSGPGLAPRPKSTSQTSRRGVGIVLVVEGGKQGLGSGGDLLVGERTGIPRQQPP
jgi:hypothetical protein